MRALLEKVRAYGHVENPFLDPGYSLGGYYPVTDFTLTIAAWLRQSASEAISELWSLITADGVAERAMFRKAMGADVISDLGFDEDTCAEIKAVHILGHRLQLYEFGKDSVGFQIGRVLATRLASIDWSPPAATLPYLRAGAENEALVMPEIDPSGRKRDLAEQAIAALLAPRDERDRNVSLWMQQIPPMARLVIAEYFGSRGGVLRPYLYYGDRKYGCCAKINMQFVDWVGCFDFPAEDAEVPYAMMKQHLNDALVNLGVTVRRAAKKDELVKEVRAHDGLLRSIFSKHLPEYRVVKPEWKLGLERWAARAGALHPVALAILKSLALQSMRVRL